MMIPIPARVPAALRAVRGIEAARSVAGIADVVISIRVGETLVPLPEGTSYLGFLFAFGDAPAGVEAALREASPPAFLVAPRISVSPATLLAVRQDH